MNLGIRVVDAFAARAFTGNPAGVCILKEPLEPRTMQAIAMEVNAAETAFLYNEGGVYNLRWFTPAAEVDLCGHATLASAHVLFTEGHAKPESTIKFSTRSGELTAKRPHDGWIQLDFPAISTVSASGLDSVTAALGIKPQNLLKSRVDFLAELSSEQQVRELVPDLLAVKSLGTQGVIVTAKTNGKYDFVSRYFAPNVGINEDPVTGSAHCALGPFWQARLGKSVFNAFQASARGGELRVTVSGTRVLLDGQAVTTIQGEINI